MRSSLKFSRKTFITLILSYLLILFIPMALSSMVYKKSGNVIEEEVSNSNLNILKQIQGSVDSRLTEVEQLISEISMNYRIEKFLSVSSPLNYKNRYQAVEILRDLQPYNINNTFIFDYYIYFKNSDSIITSTSIYTPELFYKYMLSYDDITFEQWHESLQKLDYTYLDIKQRDINRNSRKYQILTYSQSLPRSEAENPSGLIVIMLDKQNITGLLQDAAVGGYAYITDPNDNVIVNTGEGNIVGLDESISFSEKKGMVHSTKNGSKVVVTYIKSQKMGWTYVSVIPRTVLMQKLYYVRNVSILYAVLCFIVGAIVAYLLAMKNYSPIKNTVAELMRWKGDMPQKNTDEFKYIRESIVNAFNKNVQLEQKIRSLINQNDEINGMINKNKRMVKNGILVSIIKGRTNDFESVQSWLPLYNIEFPFDRFDVVLFHIDDCSRFVSENVEQDWNLIRFVISSVAEELANDGNRGYTVELERDTIALIINFANHIKGNTARELITQLSIRLKDFISEHFYTVISVGIGDVQEGIRNIKISYEQAEKAMDYKIIKGNSSVIHFDEIVDKDKDYYYPIDSELHLINFIKTGDINKCDELLQQIFEENFNKRKLNIKLIECLFFDIMSTVIKVLDVISVDYSNIFEEDPDPVNKLTSCETVDEMYEQTMIIVKKICKYININKIGHNEGLKEKILEYIDKHLVDEDLSQTKIAEHLEVSTPYLSKFFKRETGDNMVDYINRLRIAKVKELLSNSEMTLSEVACQVGYASSNTLIRIFKHYEGITPGKSRNSLYNND